MTEYRTDWMISCDDHIMEPPNLWTSRLPAELHDRAPHVVHENGVDWWLVEDRRAPMLGLLAAMGNPREQWTPDPTTYAKMRKSCYDPVARIADMDEAGIIMSLCFGSITGFCGQMFLNMKDKELALKCLRAWNDWLVNEWIATDPSRFIACIQVPLWDVQLAVAEVEFWKDKGIRALAFPENLGQLELPTLNDREGYWNPLWEVCDRERIVVCMHQGTGGKRMRTTINTPEVATMAWAIGVTSSGCLLDWLFSPVFHNYPNLQIALSEGGIGWMPYFVERAQEVLNNHRYWAAKGDRRIDHTTQTLGDPTENLVDFMTLDIRTLFRKHVSGCFITDQAGVAMIDIIGEDNISVEADFPHSDSKWPHCLEHAVKQLHALTPEQKVKVLRGNAERVYRVKAKLPEPIREKSLLPAA